MLGYFHEGDDWGIDYRAQCEAADTVHLTASNLQWHDSHRYSARQRRRVPLGGLIGSFQLEPTAAAFWRVLWLGQWVHAGTGAVMGLGGYAVGSTTLSFGSPLLDLS